MSVKTDRVVFRRHGERRSVSLGPNVVTFILSGEDTGGKYSLTEFAAAPPPALAAPLHIHKKEDESMYVLEGNFQLLLDKETVPAPAGSFMLVRRGTLHTIANLGPAVGRLLIVLTPPGFEGYWEEIANLSKGSGGKLDPAKVSAIREKYNMDAREERRL